MAEQQGRYLAKCLNEAAGQLEAPAPPPFVYRSAGSMATVGERGGGFLALPCCCRKPAADRLTHPPPPPAPPGGKSAVIELGDSAQGRRAVSWAGFSSWVAWRSAYLTRLGTMKGRLYVATNWTLTLLFGRDISQF